MIKHHHHLREFPVFTGLKVTGPPETRGLDQKAEVVPLLIRCDSFRFSLVILQRLETRSGDA